MDGNFITEQNPASFALAARAKPKVLKSREALEAVNREERGHFFKHNAWQWTGPERLSVWGQGAAAEIRAQEGGRGGLL